MPRITVRPHAALCPDGAQFEAKSGGFLCDALLRNGIALEHACEKSCACSTCHVIVRAGLGSLAPAGEEEEDQLDRAWGVETGSRLACQVVLRQQDLVLELPRYTVNLAREHD
ncbi:MAG TPA: ISC system 2Fe-2S type ferredoxin [Rhodocyclaceae bacterium]|nr:ISC system 2Fe-2S type ferredoxin [Rhodocyclaceae bacterium]